MLNVLQVLSVQTNTLHGLNKLAKHILTTILHTCGASGIFTLSLVVERWNSLNRMPTNSISFRVHL